MSYDRRATVYDRLCSACLLVHIRHLALRRVKYLLICLIWWIGAGLSHELMYPLFVMIRVYNCQNIVIRYIMEELQNRWPTEWQTTSTNRFRLYYSPYTAVFIRHYSNCLLCRAPNDMQYSFAYYHYFMNRHKIMYEALC